jgi:hypothetical protein
MTMCWISACRDHSAPEGMWGRPVAYLASDAAALITANTITVR